MKTWQDLKTPRDVIFGDASIQLLSQHTVCTEIAVSGVRRIADVDQDGRIPECRQAWQSLQEDHSAERRDARASCNRLQCLVIAGSYSQV